MDGAATGRRGRWAYLAGQPRSPSVLLPPLAVGFLGAFATGVAVGFAENDDAVVGQVRIAAPIITSLVAGMVGRGLWGWVLVSVGAAAGMAPFLLSELNLATSLFGGLLLSLPVLAPGYGFARLLAYARRLFELTPGGRSAALRGPLRRLLRAGVLVSGASCVMVAQTSIALAEAGDPSVFAAAMLGLGISGSYALYRLVDGLNRGEPVAAIPFTVVFVPVGILAASLVVSNRGPDVAMVNTLIGVALALTPTLFMAFGPWALVRIAQAQRSPTGWPVVEPVLPPVTLQEPPVAPTARLPGSVQANPAAGPVARAPDAARVKAGRGLPASVLISGLIAVACLGVASVWFLGTQGAGIEPAPGPAALWHDALEVEALLPASVAGRPLATWSVRGEGSLRLWGMTPDEIQEASETLAAAGVDLADVAQATAGRSDTGTDPPYFVLAFQIPEAARDLLGGRAIFSAGFTRDTDRWRLEERVVGGKTVSVGPMDLLVQNEHQRGRPYLYGSTALDTSFIVITDDEDWAAEAISKLPE